VRILLQHQKQQGLNSAMLSLLLAQSTGKNEKDDQEPAKEL
jgi:hypothetical protein